MTNGYWVKKHILLVKDIAMRVIGFFICLLMLLGCKELEHKGNANTHRNVDSIIDCLNRKLISYDIGIDS